jgi:hypothetical protein
MSKITAKQACNAYLRKSCTCPFCDGNIIADEMTGDDGNCQRQETHCDTCGAQFTETYRLEDVIIENGPTQTGITGIKEYAK